MRVTNNSVNFQFVCFTKFSVAKKYSELVSFNG